MEAHKLPERHANSEGTPLWVRHLWFALFVAASLIVCRSLVRALFTVSFENEYYSYILLIPVISLFLVGSERERIFATARWEKVAGGALAVAGVAVTLVLAGSSLAAGSWSLSARTLAELTTCVGAFVFCYGWRSSERALFPLAFLSLTLPLPTVVLSRVIFFLREGSTDVADWLFMMAQVPVLRHGFLLTVPGVTIEVAEECSSIHSSVALFITALLAGHFWLRRGWNIFILVFVTLPLSVFKNGVRIATLTLLSLYVDPSFLTGKLHRDGGFVFFLLALAMLWPVLVFLQRQELHDPRAPRSPDSLNTHCESSGIAS
jgi:exosortase